MRSASNTSSTLHRLNHPLSFLEPHAGHCSTVQFYRLDFPAFPQRLNDAAVNIGIWIEVYVRVFQKYVELCLYSTNCCHTTPNFRYSDPNSGSREQHDD